VRPRELLETAKEQVGDLTGLPVETVTGLDRDGDDAWRVTVEVLEVERVPNTMDVLASYEVRLSDDGEVLGFNRRRRYHRAAAEDGRG
jgi:Gas vesicle synthesis protein GvpO